MKISNMLIRRLASLLRIPDESIEMLLAASDLSGLERKSLPSELIPLNSIQISRGVLNYVVLQGLHGWVFPYAFVRQLDPDDPCFVPRAHLSVAMNVTGRNWTAIGNPESDVEPIVDPRGLITFSPNRWSLDFWFRVDHMTVFASRLDDVSQKLVNGDPIVETSFSISDIRIRLTAYTMRETTYCQIDIHRRSPSAKAIEIIAAVRPFNPEGTSLLHTLSYEISDGALHVNGSNSLRFSQKPDRVVLSTFESGDVAQIVQREPGMRDLSSVKCDVGLATGAVIFSLDPGELDSRLVVRCSPEDGVPVEQAGIADVQERWKGYRKGAMTIETPDVGLNELFRASFSTILQLTDGDAITPGPFTYHQFWFRDAAAMLLALDRAGCPQYARRVISAFPRWQERSGYYRSQQGEWDSNGQALWTIGQHALHCDGAPEFVDSLLPSMKRGIGWLRRKRIPRDTADGNTPAGLLPAGLSAEHLGLADYYYWDDFWTLAGIRSFERMCADLGREKDASSAREFAEEFQEDLDRALRFSETVVGRKAIPAGPYRGLDSGMIGSVAALYPLQLLSPTDERVTDTLDVIVSRFFRGGMFFQDFVHSGLNTYLSLQVAHAFLYRGERQKFLEIFRGVVSRASSTYAYPEAIHPQTGGGIMGDGHHGWTAAEMVLILREMLVYEEWDQYHNHQRLVLLAGAPAEWFVKDSRFRSSDVPTSVGKISLAVEICGEEVKMTIERSAQEHVQPCSCDICFPFGIAGVKVLDEGIEGLSFRVNEAVVRLGLPSGIFRIVVRPIRSGQMTLTSVDTSEERPS